ncbi:hypothetical protein JH06_0124 [Blastocystis sp. subtype 4]|uniref:hypothetical protein n=1 Tax=Blastocystis sp. subtype 4 TaxID=944170 RepID=UPI0007116635|nr:hypothetical protein JH06_0124 [Blastocystis sp. subtype 4]KNB46517.1 hypothetical protein JH06_0124 [Blastocystis sp. subtype 4]|eukprot:XP_014529960.1 hypothetical protein JH06_0124 [Blastocystis sp. subtype 4]
MSQAAFSLLSSGIKFKGLKESEKNLFKRNNKHLNTRASIEKSKTDIPSSIDFFHYGNQEYESRKRERKERKLSIDNETKEKELRVLNSESEKSLTKENEINEFRHRMHISVMGGDIPAPITTFSEMSFRKDQETLRRHILHNIEGLEYKEPTPIQMQSIPIVSNGRDLLGIAPTGSGKTAAYLLPLLQHLNTADSTHIRSIILTPTLELASQVARHMNRLGAGCGFHVIVLSKSTIAGVINQNGPVDCIISTPLRLISTIALNRIDFSQVEMLVMDEADKLFEEGFVEQIDTILAACTHPHLQRLLFSATLPQVCSFSLSHSKGVESLARTVLRDPVRVVVGVRNGSNPNVTQSLRYCGTEEGKLLALRNMLRERFEPPMLVFVQSKERARQLYNELAYENVNIDVIHSDLSPAARNEAITRFRTGVSWVLIATDLLGRGLDFLGLNTVVNYDFPQSGIDYVHRVGRTGRAGRKGTAITLFTEEDKPMLRSIANIMKISGCDIPEWMLQLKKINKNERRHLAKHAIKRDDITTQAKFDRKKKGHK